MNELVVLIGVVVYGWLMFGLGSMTNVSGETKARVAETSDEDPRPTAEGLSIPSSVDDGYDAPPTRNNPNR